MWNVTLEQPYIETVQSLEANLKTDSVHKSRNIRFKAWPSPNPSWSFDVRLLSIFPIYSQCSPPTYEYGDLHLGLRLSIIYSVSTDKLAFTYNDLEPWVDFC
jgi:hypothetical protein